ncbi:MAG: B12-binding domain-containing radical SAM protein [Planctomycetota bacterium]|jgi:hypothetical protein
MWAQGIFRTRGTTTQWGIDFIAANLKTPTTVLHYPTMSQFIAEIKKGYDYVGIAFVSATLHKLLPMVQAIREHAPSSKIVLGGYGTALGQMLEPHADHICQGEGVAFMRRLLGERVDAPIVQPDITQVQKLLSVPLLNPTGYIFAGMGCPNGCDFCATSHYFKKKHIKLLPDGPSILRAIEDMRLKHPGMDTFWISDEDFLLNEARGRGFLEAIRASSLPPLGISIFSSVKALSQFSVSELVEMGVDWIWIGFEGKRAGYAKMEGRSYQELFADLHAHGISPEIIKEEFEEMIALRPSMSQFLIYGPAPGTPLLERMKKEGRLIEEIYADHTLHDGFTLEFLHPHIGQAEMSRIQRRLYREEFRRLGPTPFRVAEDFLEGYVTLRDHPNPRIRAKARRYGRDARASLKIIQASKRYVSAESGRWLERLRTRLLKETGPMTLKERIQSRLAPALLQWEQLKLRYQIGQQPEFSRNTYRIPETGIMPLGEPLAIDGH